MTPPGRPSILFVSLFSSHGSIRDDFHTIARALAPRSELFLLTTPVFRGREVPAAAATWYAPLSKRSWQTALQPGTWNGIRRFVRQRRFDLLLVHTEHPLHVPIAMMATAHRTVFWCHDPEPHSGSRWATGLALEAGRRWLARQSDRVVVSCQAMRDIMRRRYRLPDQRIAAWPLCTLDPLVFPDLANQTRDIDVLFFGRMEQYKGLDTLTEALTLLEREGLRIGTIVAGTGPLRLAPMSNATILNRHLPDRELAALIARARVVVLPYHDATGSQAPQAAFAYGTPVIATRVGCLAQYVVHGESGLVVAPGAPAELAGALRQVLTNGKLWETLSAGARRRSVVDFAPERLANAILAEAAEKRG